MDRLEKFMQKNRESFDDHVPSKELWSRIEAETAPKKRITLIPLISKVAAVLIIVLGVGLGINTLIKNNSSGSESAELSTEAMEAAIYYESQINKKRSQIYELTASVPEVRNGLDEDLALLDSAMNDIKKDLNDNIANEEVLEAMIQNYRLKLQILEDIFSYVNEEDIDTPKTETYDL